MRRRGVRPILGSCRSAAASSQTRSAWRILAAGPGHSVKLARPRWKAGRRRDRVLGNGSGTMQMTIETVIHAGRLLATPGEAPKPDQSMRIVDGRIKSVASGFIDPPTGARLIDLKDKFVLPGLIDCHVHLTTQLDRDYRLRLVEDSDPKVGFDAAHLY